RIQLVFTGHFRDQDLPINGATCRLYLSQFNLELRLVRVSQHGDDGGFGSELVYQMPVALPSGRLRPATKPALTGSKPVVKTIGPAALAALIAGTAMPLAPMTDTSRRTSSAAISRTWSARSSAQRYTTATFWPSTNPASFRPCRNAPTSASEPAAVVDRRK